MKVCLAILISVSLFTSCSSEENTRKEETIVEKVIDPVSEVTISNSAPVYESKIRGNVVIGEIYTDTLTFLSFDGNYDYWFGLFLTEKQDTVYVICDDVIEESNNGKEVVLRWEVDSLYEAGEGDELYYQERVVSLEINNDLEKGFEKFLNVFVPDFINPNSDMSNYIYSEMSFQTSYNIGLYCTLSKLDSVDKHDWFQDFEASFFKGLPEGHFCDGYPNIVDGFYYERILQTQLPTFDKLSGEDFIEEEYDIPKSLLQNEVMKITVIKDEYHRGYLYFLFTENKWFFFAQDLCDCSA